MHLTLHSHYLASYVLASLLASVGPQDTQLVFFLKKSTPVIVLEPSSCSAANVTRLICGSADLAIEFRCMMYFCVGYVHRTTKIESDGELHSAILFPSN